MINTDLKGKNAIVGGSTKGIGKAVAIELAEAGANVILLARNMESLKEVLSELDTQKGQNHQYLCVDYTQTGTLKKVIDSFIEEIPDIHILVNNTGGPAPGPAYKAEPEAYLNAFNLHLICNQILAGAVIPGMQKAGYGRIINIISTSVKQPLPNLGVSNTVRGAVANWSKTLAMELGSFGITVNNVLPGATYTDRLKSIIDDKVKKTGKSYEEVKTEMENAIPAGRFADPKETAQAVLFLASPSAAYINGINLPVDGGRTSCL